MPHCPVSTLARTCAKLGAEASTMLQAGSPASSVMRRSSLLDTASQADTGSLQDAASVADPAEAASEHSKGGSVGSDGGASPHYAAAAVEQVGHAGKGSEEQAGAERAGSHGSTGKSGGIIKAIGSMFGGSG